METIKYVIVDDNSLAHSMILRSMEIYPDYECIGQYYDVMSATTALKGKKPQLIFLDVEMPHLMGFELIKHIDKSIKVVITTSHRKFAYESFEYGVFDFLSKPINPVRLFETINRINDAIETEYKNKFSDKLICKQKISYLTVTRLKQKKFENIEKNTIYFITKSKNEAEIHTDDKGIFYKYISLNDLIDDLPSNEFSFVNQSYIINIKKAITHDGETVILKDGTVLKISKEYRANFKNLIQ